MKKLLDNATLSALQMGYCNQVGWLRPQQPWLLIQQESGGMLVEQAIHPPPRSLVMDLRSSDLGVWLH